MIKLADEKFMQIAINEASEGFKVGEQPFGSVLEKNGQIISVGRNLINSTFDITSHAEIQAIKSASISEKTLDFSGATIYATWEPCPMCLGAIISAKISKLVIAGRAEQHNKKYGNYSVEEFVKLSEYNNKLKVITGMLEKESRSIVEQWTNKNK